MTRPTITTQWTRNRYTNNIIDVSGNFIVDVDGNQLQGLSNENLLTTTWS